MDRKGYWNELAAQLAVDSIRSSTAAGSGHPTSSLSAAHLLAVLWSDHLRTDIADPTSLANDRFVLSKGHASPLMFSVLKAVGAITDEQLRSFRKMDSPVQGHPVPLPEMPWVDVATGSLGQGLPIALGMALAMRMDNIPARVWCLMGDSEAAEGSVWEAMANASHHGADNLIALLDVNRLGQRGPTMLGWDLGTYAARARAFGWHAIEVDGHDASAIDDAYAEAEGADRPALVIAKTEKGHGVSFLEDAEGWHGKALSAEEAERAIAELGGERDLRISPPKPEADAPSPPKGTDFELPEYVEAIATRKAFGETLAALAARPDIVVIDAEVSNSTHTEDLQKVAPERFVESYIAEQNMVGMAVGMQVLGKVVFAATFAAFLTRAYDFIRMAAVGRANLRLSGSHAGVSIGEDGPSQMALEDLAMMRAVFGSTVVYPCDGNSTAKLVAQMADLPGISYIRTTREKTPSLYDSHTAFPIGGSVIVRASDGDRVTLVGAGITVHESLAAAKLLAAEDIAARVVDCYSIKPIDASTLRAALSETGLLVTVEDHWLEGGLGDAVLAALASEGDLSGRVVKIGITQMPGSGTPEQLRDWAGISAARIAERVRELFG
jgi:transketolase